MVLRDSGRLEAAHTQRFGWILHLFVLIIASLASRGMYNCMQPSAPLSALFISLFLLVCIQPCVRAHHYCLSLSVTLSLSDFNLLSVPFVRTSFGARSFSVAAPKI